MLFRSSRSTILTVTPVVNLSSISVNAVEGGFSTYGSVSLTIPAQLGGATITLASGNTSLVTVPASVSVPQGYTSTSFTATTVPVTALTTVPVTATFNGTTVTANLTLSPAPVVSVSSVTMPSTVGGQAFFGAVILNNFVRDPNGATISLVSSDTTLVQVPATVFIPQYGSSASFSGTTTVVKNITNVSVVASYNGSSVNGVIASSNYSQMSDVSSHNSGGNASATAIGNSLNVQVQGTWNTVIVNSKQENNGDQTANASLNGKLDM